ncbi:FG-GAP-like repeat-containing protein [Streptomyces sp. NPDC005151]
MNRRALVGGRTAVTASLVVAGLGPLTAPAAAAETPQGSGSEVVVPAGARYLPRTENLRAAGETGYLHTQEGTSGMLWTDYATGTTTAVTDLAGSANAGLFARQPATGRVAISDPATGRSTEVVLPAGHFWFGAFGPSAALSYERAADRTISALHLIGVADDGEATDTPLPASALPAGTKSVRVLTQDLDGAVLETNSPTGRKQLLIGYGDGSAVEVFAPLIPKPTSVVLSAGRILGYTQGPATAYTVPRDEPGATPVTTAIPALPDVYRQPVVELATVGDWILVTRAEPDWGMRPAEPLMAVPVGGGAPVTLLDKAVGQPAVTPGGDALVVGGSGSEDWAVRRISADGSGAPVLSTVRRVEPMPAQIDALALGGGRLSVVAASDKDVDRNLYAYDVAATGTPTVGARNLVSRFPVTTDACTADPVCAPLHALGNGRVAYSWGTMVEAPIDATGYAWVDLPAEGNRIIDSAGRYTVINSGNGKQYIGDFEQYRDTNVTHTRAITAASVWGTKLWKPGPTAGSLNSYDLKTKKTADAINLGSGCVPKELQAVGRWIYWNCGPAAKSGVWDRTAGKNIAVPSGDALLGDGFLVRQDTTARKLLLTDFHGGAGQAAVTSDLAALPDGGTSSGRWVDWTVDKYGGQVAYRDREQRIHLKQITLPRSPVSVIESRTDDYVFPRNTSNPKGWHGTWQLSRPPVSWSLAFKNTAGKTVRTLRSSGHEGALVTATWAGTDDNGAMVTGGKHSWTLTVDAGDGPRTVRTGSLHLTGAKSAFRDSDGDGDGELLSLTNSGRLEQGSVYGNGWIVSSSSGWNTGYRFVEFGDMDGDRCVDTLVRDTAGTLFRYSGRCRGVVARNSPRKAVGGGWNQYNVLTSPGDMNGDGKADLIARQTSTGDVYFYAGKGDATFKPRVRIATNWKAYAQITGAGDLNGDGRGDLLAHDTKGVLWRYYASGDAKVIKARTQLFTKWGGSYNAVIGVGDMTEDGKPDLLSRDGHNDLWVNAGNGKGSFGARKSVYSSYTGYKALS